MQSAALTLMLIHCLINALREVAELMKLRRIRADRKWLHWAWMIVFPTLVMVWLALSCSPLVYYGLQMLQVSLH